MVQNEKTLFKLLILTTIMVIMPHTKTTSKKFDPVENPAYNLNDKLREELYKYSDAGDIKNVRKTLIRLGEKNKQHELNTTALHFAAGHGHVKTITLLIQSGVNVNVRDKYGRTALFHAAEHNGYIKTVKTLIDLGANVNAKDDRGRIALLFSTNEEIIKILIESGTEIHAKDFKGKTLLHKVATIGNKNEVIKALINLGLDVNAKDNKGETPLHKAAKHEGGVLQYSKKKSLIKFLVSLGGDVNAKNNKGETPLHKAAIHSPDGTYSSTVEKTIEELVALGADMHIKDYEGETAIQKAAKYGKVVPIRAFIALGFDISIPDNQSKTVAMLFHEATKDLPRKEDDKVLGWLFSNPKPGSKKSFGGCDWGRPTLINP